MAGAQAGTFNKKLGTIAGYISSRHGNIILANVQDGVQVVANRKVFREFTGVRIAQQWQAHTGVIWTVSFSDTGAFMATGGKDRIIRVWENKRAPIEAGCVLPCLPRCCNVMCFALTTS